MLEAVRAGVPIVHACHYAGLHPASHFRAIEAAEQADELLEAAEARGEAPPTLTDRQAAYREYRDRFTSARAEVAVVHVALIGKAARGGQVIREVERVEPDGTEHREVERARPEWKASAWLLSKSFPAELGDRRAVEHSGPGGGPIEHGPSKDAVVSLAERLAEVAEAQRGQLPGGWEPGEAPRAIGPAVRADLDDVADAEIVDGAP